MAKSFIDRAEEVALAGLDAISAFLAYQGDNKTYEKKAKAGAAVVQGFTRHYASQTNREMLKLAMSKQAARELPSGD